MSVTIGTIGTLLSDFLSKKAYTQIVILVDQNTKKHCLPKVDLIMPAPKVIEIKAGEKHKNIETCQKIWQAMTNLNLDRHALMINLGGGVIGDMGGFCAATYKRGIDFIQIPTTLLSQVDASVGGKLGIDFNGLKNHIGVFTLPNAVLVDSQFLQTLPSLELRSGFAEIVKHCLIKDQAKWKTIKILDLEEQNLPDLIAHSIEIKKAIVAEDFTEQGPRKTLNFGHTMGHAVETFFLENKSKKLLHGEAVAAGMIMESYIGYKKGMFAEESLNEIEEFIFAVYGRIKIDKADFNAIIALSLHDKKNKGKVVRASILDKIGSCQYDIPISKVEMKKALEYYVGG
jgi:3-dehydroquinate synthase